MIFVILTPIMSVFITVRSLIPNEILHERPDNILQVLIPAIGTAFVLMAVMICAYLIWLVMARLIFGASAVRDWLEDNGTQRVSWLARFLDRLTRLIL